MADLEKQFQDLMAKEGGSKVTADPTDLGGRTQYGVSERSNPAAWADGKVTESEAREIFLSKYVVFPKFNLIPASHAKLQEQLIDFGFHSGPQLAIMKLQRILNLKEDGVLGPLTLKAITAADPRELNNKLVVSRAAMITKIVQKSPSQLQYLSGWISRALAFLT